MATARRSPELLNAVRRRAYAVTPATKMETSASETDLAPLSARNSRNASSSRRAASWAASRCAALGDVGGHERRVAARQAKGDRRLQVADALVDALGDGEAKAGGGPAGPEEQPHHQTDRAPERYVFDAHHADLPPVGLNDIEEDQNGHRETGLSRGKRDSRRRETGEEDGEGQEDPKEHLVLPRRAMITEPMMMPSIVPVSAFTTVWPVLRAFERRTASVPKTTQKACSTPNS